MPHLTITRKASSAVVHPTCSMRHLDAVEHLQAVAAACADEVDTPVHAECCGFADDRGMLRKELTESTVRHEAEEVTSRHYDAHLCANRICEIGMEYVTGRPYYSVLVALERATRHEVSEAGSEPHRRPVRRAIQVPHWHLRRIEGGTHP